MNPEKSVPSIEKIQSELEMAYLARQVGNAGKARVCARRAAGWAIQRHLAQAGVNLNTTSALEHIRYFHAQPGITPQSRLTLEYLMQKVVKDSLDEDSYWPLPEVDLVQEAHWFVEDLLNASFTPPTI